ncbi:hypothetical protein TVAG_259460 [Trichomonas vaginalis G3]|uniref:Uncharacterized protein n=1 Tax=Trichomonas vaginalis (strain ATCC PRA-98 / G3) TaxID=412133 RepID=A2EBZ7_TRIV3|nr:hypothetical protein TVAGG3_0652270 [Trichomonas vaginalis G3]EAY09865.1 hypothetical protein TVAG_259460 [Trichomonas vaginalis G3]KAI5505907.1 hypothetical protein TVAGG3_0652270 [Trichomonas vaginalis G3]|eukprot:XP_001322088.1 hypothetical protein [Trichomonas vaginalis G3]
MAMTLVNNNAFDNELLPPGEMQVQALKTPTQVLMSPTLLIDTSQKICLAMTPDEFVNSY